jgi:hypothetical protein
MRVKFAVLQNSFQQTNEPKVTRAYIWRIRWVRQSENMMLLEFRRNLWPWWQVELSMCTKKVDWGFRRQKFRFALFKSGKMWSMKYTWLNLIFFGIIGMLQAATPKLRLAARGENGPCRTNHHFWTFGARFWFATSDTRRRRLWWLIQYVSFLIPNFSSKKIWWQIFVPLCAFIADNVCS